MKTAQLNQEFYIKKDQEEVAIQHTSILIHQMNTSTAHGNQETSEALEGHIASLLAGWEVIGLDSEYIESRAQTFAQEYY